MEKNNIKKLCLSAVLAAFCFAMDYATTALEQVSGGTFKLSLSALPIIISAVCCGPLWGAATGFVGTFMTQLITYGFTPTTILWVLPAAIRGLSVGLLFIAFRRSVKYYWLMLEIIISALLVTAANTLVIFIDSKLYNYYSPAVVFGSLGIRLVSAVITSVIFALIMPPIIKIIKKHIIK